MTGPGGELFEYWGHAASLLPAVQQPLFRWRMAQHGPSGDSPTYAARREAWRAANAGYITAVLAEIRDRGPLSASQLMDPRRQDGQWWERRSLGRRALEWMFARGELAAWRTPSFEKVYDLPERVLPEAVLSQPTPPVEEAHRRLLVLAARSLGVGTLGDLAGYYALKTRAAKPRLAELVEAGELVRVGVEGWPEPGYTTPDAGSARLSRDHATLLSPFDSLIWDRRPDAAPVRFRLPNRGLRPGGGPATRLLRAAPIARRSARRSTRPEGRPAGKNTARPGRARRARCGHRDGRRRGGSRARLPPELATPRSRRRRRTRWPCPRAEEIRSSLRGSRLTPTLSSPTGAAPGRRTHGSTWARW